MLAFCFFNEELDRWQALPIEQFRNVSGRPVPRRGIVEVLAQRMDVHWAEGIGTYHREILVPPQVLQYCRASCLMTGVHEGVPSFSIPELIKLAALMRFFMLAELPDGASSCRRKLWATYARLPKNALFVAGACAAHQAHRIFQQDCAVLIADVYHLKCVTQLTSHANRLREVSALIVDRDLLVLDMKQVSDDEFSEWRRHREQVLEHSLYRRAHRTRGRLDGPGDALEMNRDEAALNRRASMMCEMLNGDFRKQCFIHVERGCCPGGIQETKEKYMAALIEG